MNMKREDETQTEFVIRLIQEEAVRKATPQIQPSSEIINALRGAAADWMKTEVGYAYGQTILDILEGR
jgi:hypothetical protein